MAKRINVSEGDILVVVTLLKVLFTGDRNIRRILEKVDTPEEIARIKGAVQDLVDLVQDL